MLWLPVCFVILVYHRKHSYKVTYNKLKCVSTVKPNRNEESWGNFPDKCICWKIFAITVGSTNWLGQQNTNLTKINLGVYSTKAIRVRWSFVLQLLNNDSKIILKDGKEIIKCSE